MKGVVILVPHINTYVQTHAHAIVHMKDRMVPSSTVPKIVVVLQKAFAQNIVPLQTLLVSLEIITRFKAKK